ncbi:hypothetical protein COL26b_014144 [Colletotrichum chrysophilum]|uniref:uncharacterized protein n=1 Tax=Colletotrichum chrysophilum TaxID=1836956 RepID=UPI002301E1D1|nr:uncharacterized protein COL26b_014144 [Colletotrichum chrysophilum]KAJ0360204.1 hypothetical protein COL26b_014144 [Colletotrichum chrysophilum]
MSQVPRPIDEEDLAGYRPGGYHPVRIGDHFNHGKYKVLNKLEYGGTVLFDGSWTPQDPYTGEAQLAQMTSLLGAFPKSLLSRSRECDRYFTEKENIYGAKCALGNLLKPSTFGSLCLNDMCKNRLNCNMSDSDRADFLDFIMAMIRLDPAERRDAKTLLGHKWIQES